MIKGVNFLIIEKFALTYKKMALSFAVVFLICLVAYSIQVGRHAYLKKKIVEAQAALAVLKAKQEQTQSKSQLQGAGFTAHQAVRPLFEKTIHWNHVLKDLSRRMPTQVWLKGVRNYVRADGAGPPAAVIDGYAHDIGSIALFVSSLEKSPYFKSVVLTNTTGESKGEKSMFQFSIDTEVRKK